MWSRVLKGAFERLELLEAKVSRAVLRGGGDGNTASLPDGRKRAGLDTTRNDFWQVEALNSTSPAPYPTSDKW